MEIFGNSLAKKSNNNFLGLLCGGASIWCWSVGACLFYFLNSLPLFQVLAMAQVIGGVIGIACERRKYSLKYVFTYLKGGWPFLAVLLINSFCYALAFRQAPAAQVDLINYLWPTMLVVGESIRVGKPLSKVQIFGIIVCLLGVLFLLLPELAETSFSFEYLVGYLAALGSAISWAVYSILGNHKPRTCKKSGGISMDVLILGLLFAGIQSLNGGFVPLELWQLGTIAVLGVFVYGLAFIFWNKGLQSGQSTLIGGMANAIPVLSIAWLVVAGVVEVSFALVISTSLVVLGCVLLRPEKEQNFRKEIDKGKTTPLSSSYSVMSYLNSEYSECG